MNNTNLVQTASYFEGITNFIGAHSTSFEILGAAIVAYAGYRVYRYFRGDNLGWN